MEGFQPQPELSNDQTEPIAASAPEKKRNIFMDQAEKANKSITDLREELHAAEARELDIKFKMGRMEYTGKLSDLSDTAAVIRTLREQIANHPDNKVTRMDYADPNRKQPGPKGFDYLHGDDRKYNDKQDKAA